MALSEREKLSLRYLAKARRPLWGGHLERGEPLTDPDMKRWLELKIIEPVAIEKHGGIDHGYMLTDLGAHLI